jgi:uncharacterized protein YbbC (DUF1343 family)
MQLGIDVFAETIESYGDLGRCALLCNQASVNSKVFYSRLVLKELLGDRLTCLFSPQHGIDSTEQDNMIETEHGVDYLTGLKTYSLYSEVRHPEPKMLHQIDTLIVDLQIVGCRVYTFKATLLNVLQAAKDKGIRVVVLDRPNPLGGEFVDGRLMDPGKTSFVAPFPMPMQHGLTPCELAKLFNKEIGCELLTVAMRGWEPAGNWEHNGLEWVYTSPNVPSFETCTTYPGQVFFEATNVSEGRGTTMPFLLNGADFIDCPSEYVEKIRAEYNPEGISLRPIYFSPTFHKGAGKKCAGVHMVVSNPALFSPYRLGLAMLKAAASYEGFELLSPPYEYEYERLPLDVIFGVEGVISKVKALAVTDEYWEQGIPEFIEAASACLLYNRKLRVPA